MGAAGSGRDDVESIAPLLDQAAFLSRGQVARATEAPQRRQREVLADGELRDDALGLPVGRDERDAELPGAAVRRATGPNVRAAGSHRWPGDHPVPRGRTAARVCPRRPGRRCRGSHPPVPRASTPRSHLPRTSLRLERHRRVRAGDDVSPEVRIDVVADHQRRERAAVEALDVVRPDSPAATQHGDPVGEREDLVHAVRDVQDAGAALADLRHDVEESLDLVVREDRGGLVEHENAIAVPALQRRRDRDDGPLDRCRGGERAVDVEVDVERGEDPAGLLLLLAPQHAAAEAAGEAAAQGQVVLGAELEDQPEVLVDEAQAVRDGLADLELGTVHLGNRAGIGRVVGGEELDQRRLARAVLAHQGVDLAAGDLDADIVERPGAGERLREALDPQDGA